MIRAAVFFSILCAAQISAQEAVPPEAVKYHELLRKRPQAGTLFDRFHDAWLGSGTSEGLADFLKTKAAAPDATAADQQVLALLHARRGNDAEALTALDAALKLAPQNAEAWYEKARVQGRMLDFDGALKSLEAAAATQPADRLRIEIARQQGRMLLRLGRTPEALKAWQSLAQQHPDDLDLVEEIVELMAEESLYADAASQAKSLVEKTRDASQKLTRQLRLGDLLLRSEKRDEAMSVLDAALAQSGQDSWVETDVLSRIEQVYRREDDIETLKVRLQGLFAAHPSRAGVAVHLARVLASLDSKEEAAKIFTTLLARNPGRRDLQEAYITLLEDMERIPEAVVQAQVVVTQNPDDKESLIHLATLQQRDGKTDAAQATLETYLKKSAVNGGTPDHDHLRVARLLESWELKDAARKAYENLQAAHPESISAREELAHYLHRSGDDDAALPIWRALAKTGGVEDMLRIGQALIAHGMAREAQDILAGRQADFATQPRYLALLAQCALTNKDNENAVKWSRARLALTIDAAALQEAVRQAHIAVREAKAEAATIAELQQAGAAITLPNRCLLSEMLEEAGQSQAAEAVLKATNATPEQQLMLGSQLVRLLEMRQEWTKAADAVAALLQLPGGMTSDRTRQLVSLHRRGMETDKALAAIPEWKKLSPGAVQPWLEEAGILMEQAKESAALDVLRTAARKFADDREVKGQLASFLAQAGKTDEAAQVYMQLYEQTEDVISRMRVLAPLAQMSQLQGTLPKLVEDFQQRQRQNRASAQPWLALAEIHRATGKDEERRRCLYEASRLRPKDLALLTEISRCEEENGLEAEALRTLQAAAPLDKTNATRQKIARLMIATGDEDAGYRLMFEITGGSSGDARALEQMADSLCEQGEWERAIKLLEPVLPLHPADYRLHYLHAVALEESDQPAAAVKAFMHLLEMHEELPAVLAAAAVQSATAQPVSYSGEIRDLPAGAAEWMQLPRVAHQAYEYRQKQMRGGYAKFGTGTLYLGLGSNPVAAPPLPAGWLQQPANVTNLSAFALYHLVEIGQGLGAEDKKALIAGLDAAGLRDSGLLLEVPMYQGQIGIPVDLLEQHPQHAALHALWLINQAVITPETLPVLKRCMVMFKTRHPLLALQAGMHALTLDDKEAVALVGDALQAAENIRADESHVLSMLVSGLTRYSTLQFNEPLPEALLTRAIALGRQWLKAPGRTLRPSQVDYTGLQFIQALGNLKRWDDLAAVLEEDNARILKTQPASPPATMMYFSGGYGNPSQVQPQPLQPAWSGLDVSAYHAALIASLRNGNGSYVMYQGGAETNTAPDEPDIRAGLTRTAAQLTVPGLKTLMNLRLRDTAAVNAAVDTLLKAPSLRVDHWLFAAWVAQSLGSWEKTIFYLHEAARLKPTQAQRRSIDNAILYAITRIPGDKTPEVHSAAGACITRVMAGAMQPHEQQMLAGIAAQAGLAEQAAELQKVMAKPRAPVPAAASPYSRNVAFQRGSNAAATIPRLLSTGRQDAAFAELKRQLKPLAAEWLGPNWSNATSNAQNLRQSLESKQVNMRFFEQLQSSAAPGWRQQLELGAFFELMDQDDRARACFQRTVKENPRSWGAHFRLAVLLAAEDQPAALGHLLAIPDTEMRQFAQRFMYEAGNSHRQTSSFEQRLALIKLLAAWIGQHFNPKVRMDPMLAQMLMNLPQQIQQGEWNDPFRFPSLYDFSNNHGVLTAESKKAQAQLRAAHDELCKAMIHVPVLSEGGFGPLAGLAERNGEPLAPLESLAREALEAQAWFRRSTPALGYWYGRSQNRYAGGAQIPMPHPEDFLLRSLARNQQMDRLETELLPLVQNAQGAASVKQTRAYARLFTCQENDFPQAAKEWVRSQTPYPDPSCGQEITRIWAQRKIGAPIHGFFLDRLRNPQMSVNPNELAGYVQILSENGHQDEAADFARQLRDFWLGKDVEKRRQALAGYIREMTGGRRSFGWMGVQQQGPRPDMYVSFHRELVNQRCFAVLELAVEDHLLDEPAGFQQFASALANDSFVKGPAEKFLASLDALKVLAPAPSCRLWFSQMDRSYTHLGYVLRMLDGPDGKEARERLVKMINARQPQTFGADLFVSFLEDNTQKAAYALPLFLKRRAGELGQLSIPAKREVAAFLRQRVQGYPGTLDAETARLILPLQAAERSQSEETADLILASTTLDGAGLDEYNAPRQIPKIIADLARTNRDKAVSLLEHSIKLVKGSQHYLQSLRQPGSSNPVSEMIKAMGRAPQLMNEVVALAEKEKLPDNWLTEFGYAIEQDNALADKEHVLALFTGTPFVAEAESFRSLCMPGGSILSRVTSSLSSTSRRAAHDALLADLKARQPQTFGVRFVLALIPGSSTQLNTFIKTNAAEFARLHSREAAGVLETFAYRDSRFRNPETLPADLQPAVEPLLKACAANDEDLRRALLSSVRPVAYNDIESLVGLLRRIAKRDRAPAVELFDKITPLVLAGQRGQNWSSGSGLLGYWLREAAGIPQIFTRAMKAADVHGILGEREWIQGVASELTNDNQMQSAETVRMFIDGSAMVADVQDFRSYAMEKDADGSILGRIARYVRGNKEVQSQISGHLRQLRPATFGSELLLALIQDQPQAGVVEFVKTHTADISSMPVEQSIAFTLTIEPSLTPLSIYARGVPALETMLKAQAQKARDTADSLLALKNRESLHRDGNSEEQFARSLALIAQHDPLRAKEVFTHLLKLYDAYSDSSSNTSPAYTYPARFLSALYIDPGLWPLRSREATARKLSTERNWVSNHSCDSCFNGHETDAAFIIDACTRAGWFADAAAFDPLPGCGGTAHDSLLAAFLDSLWKSKKREPVRAILRRHIDAQTQPTFGMAFIRAMVEENGPAGMEDFAKTHAAEFAQVPKQGLLSLYDIAAGRSRVLSDASILPAPVRDALKPVHAERLKQSESFRDQVAQGKPFPGFKLSETTFIAEWRKALAERLRASDWEGAAVLFNKGAQIMEDQQSEHGWGNGGSNNGWTLRSGLFEDFCQSSLTSNAVGFAIKLLYEDESTRLQHSGWHAKYGWGYWMEMRWTTFGGRADPGAAADALIKELTPLVPAERTALLALGFHNFLTRLWKSDASAVVAWAEQQQQRGSGARQALLRELAIAGRLYLEADPSGMPPDARCAIGGTPVVDLLWKHYRKAMTDEKLPPRVRVALGHHLCATYPLAVPPDIVLAAARVTASENEVMHAVHGYNVAHIGRRFALLPVDAEWREIAQNFWDGWVRRMSYQQQPSNRGRVYGVYDEPMFAMLQIAARAKQDAWIDRLLNEDAPTFRSMRTTVAVLALAGAEAKAAELLKKHATEMTNWNSAIYKWEPYMQSHIPTLAKACGDPVMALFGEIILAEAQDWKPALVNAFKSPSTFEQRIAALAPRVASTPFSSEALRVQVASIVANYAPVAARDHLKDLLSAAVQKQPVTELAVMEKNGERMHASYVHGLVAASRAAAGDDSAARQAFDVLAEFKTDTNSYLVGYARNNLGNALSDAVTEFWKNGQAREIKLWQPLCEHILSLRGPADDHSGYAASLLMALLAAAPDDAISAYHQQLSQEKKTVLVKALSQKNIVISATAALAGREGSSARLPVAQRVQFVINLLNNPFVGRISQPFQLMIRDHRILTPQEVVAHSSAIALASPRNGRTALELADFAADAGKADTAFALLDKGLADASSNATNTFDILVRRLSLQIRQHQRQEAAATLETVLKHDRAGSKKLEMTALQKLTAGMN